MLSFYLSHAQRLAFSTNRFSHQWFTLPSMPYPSLRAFTATPNIKWKSETTRIGTGCPPCPRHPAEEIIYGSCYDVDSSINKGLSLRLLQPSQSFQRYFSSFFACADRDVGAAEKNIHVETVIKYSKASCRSRRGPASPQNFVYRHSFAGTA